MDLLGENFTVGLGLDIDGSGNRGREVEGDLTGVVGSRGGTDNGDSGGEV